MNIRLLKKELDNYQPHNFLDFIPGFLPIRIEICRRNTQSYPIRDSFKPSYKGVFQQCEDSLCLLFIFCNARGNVVLVASTSIIKIGRI